ncbi:MAG: hypothetical protein U0136_10610 [Bdellovibrionota bacterium]
MKTNLQNETGTVILESALLMALIALVCVGNLFNLGQKLNDDFELVGQKMQAPADSSSKSSKGKGPDILDLYK